MRLVLAFDFLNCSIGKASHDPGITLDVVYHYPSSGWLRLGPSQQQWTPLTYTIFGCGSIPQKDKRKKNASRLSICSFLSPFYFDMQSLSSFFVIISLMLHAVVPFRFSFSFITFFIFHISEDNRKKSRAALAAKVAVETSPRFKPERKAVSVRLQHQLKSISL